MADKKPKRQDSTVLSKTLAGQLSKSEKRSKIASDMRALKQQAYQAVKQVRLMARMAKNV
jgi:hypothetical protein